MTKENTPLQTSLTPQIQQALELHQQGKRDEAEDIYRSVLAEQPDNIYALHFLGLIAMEAGVYQDAEKMLAWCLTIEPKYPQALNSLGKLFHQQQKLDRAYVCFQEAIKYQPDFDEAWNNVGTVLHENGDFSAAQHSYQQALTINPDKAMAWFNLANTQHETGQLQQAINSYHKALDLEPDYASAWNNLSSSLLMMGDWSRGWQTRKTAWRYQPKNIKQAFELLPGQLWQGQELTGQSLLIYGAEGVGDDIMYAMFLPLLALQAKKITLLCEPRLIPLYQRSFSQIQLLPKTINTIKQLSSSDYQLKIASTFMLSNMNKPKLTPYSQQYLQPNPQLTQKLKNNYHKQSSGKPIIGIAWRSGNLDTGKQRSVDLPELISRIENAIGNKAMLLSLQYGDIEQELNSCPHYILWDHSVDQLKSLDRFAAQVAACGVFQASCRLKFKFMPPYVLLSLIFPFQG